MKAHRLLTAAAATVLATALTAPIALAQGTSQSAPSTGTRSLAEVLTSDGNQFDRDWYDYDIVTEAVLAVLAAKPDSPVGLLTDGTVPLTAFLPNDRAFQVLAADLTHRWIGSESGVFTALVDAVGVDAIEQVLLYHVIPGATITARQAVRSNGAVLQTALDGATFQVKVRSRWVPLIELKDQDPNDINPYVNPRALDINKGNRQIAHGLVFVLRPADL